MWEKIKNYEFMGESGMQWFLFLGVFVCMAAVWKFILNELKD